MAKRSTIGENPLDAMQPASPLDAVVPDLTAPRSGRPQEIAPEVKERLEKLEAGSKAAAADAAQLRGWIAPLKDDSARAQAEVARLKAELAQLHGDVERLHDEIAALKAEMALVRAATKTPSDIPWWLGGRKK